MNHLLATNICSRFSINSETNVSELIENRDDMFPRYYMQSDISNILKSTRTMCYPSPKI